MKKVLLFSILIGAVAFTNCSNQHNVYQMRSESTQEQTDSITRLKINRIAAQSSSTIVSQALHAPVTTTNDSTLDISNHILEVKITNITTGEVLVNTKNHTEITKFIYEVEPGTFFIEAKSADINDQLPLDGVVGWDQPTFALSQTVTIEKGENLSYDLVAKQNTAGVRIRFSDVFDGYYPCFSEGEIYRAELTTSDGTTVVFPNGETRTAYFQIGEEDVILTNKVILTKMNNAGILEDQELTIPEAIVLPTTPLKAAYIYDAIYTIVGQ